jgi:hypothetical protein
VTVAPELLYSPRNRPNQIQIKQTPQRFFSLDIGGPAIGFGYGFVQQPVSFDQPTGPLVIEGGECPRCQGACRLLILRNYPLRKAGHDFGHTLN